MPAENPRIAIKRAAYALWILILLLFAAAHFWHLRADFPNHSPWEDWAKYTDEGWYGNAAIRAHLFGNWYLPGDFNPAPAVPLWPALEWLLFAVTGVSIQAARGLAVAFFFLNLFLSYKLFRERGPRWVGLVAVTLLVTSPFLYCFSRLAILEPLLMALTLTAFNLAIRLPRYRHPDTICSLIGLLFTAMLFTKTTAVFLLPALVWIIVLPHLDDWRKAVRLTVVAGGAAVLAFCSWMLLVVNAHLFPDFKYLFFINTYDKPTTLAGRLMSLWWSFHGGLWADLILIPLAGLLILVALFTRLRQPLRYDPRRHAPWQSNWTAGLWRDPLFSGSALATAGYIAFMAYQNHPQPRYYVVVAFFSFFVVTRIAAQLFYAQHFYNDGSTHMRARQAGYVILGLLALTAVFNSIWTLRYILHPEYTWVTAAENLTRYIDQHPNGNRQLVSISGDEITLITNLPSICDDFGTLDLPDKLAQYQPGWFASWNDLDPGTLEDLHVHYSLEQVASFPAFDDPDRNVLVLFKLHPLAKPRTQLTPAMRDVMPDDKIDIDVE
ncbi:MAG TPA: glycosyltransferase family 39 protein [Acidobacteriaceae bacterium]|nr:glycosyltransferase family 39 protein [Acidobacteriaceae bacterium]